MRAGIEYHGRKTALSEDYLAANDKQICACMS